MHTTAPHPPPGRSAGRIVAIAAAAVLGALAVTSVALGGALVGLHSTKRDADGFYTTGNKTLKSPAYALVADKLDAGGPGWLFRKNRLGTIRVSATGTAEKPVFVGIARTSEVDHYLRGVAQDEVSDFDIDPFSVSYEHHAGSVAPAAPAAQTFWSGRASGSGRQTLSWPVQKGNWAVVVMNADGSRGVETGVAIGAKPRFVFWLGSALLGLGGVLAAAALGLLFGGRSPRRRATASGAGAAQPVMP